jgi:hypothetical protein
MEPIGTQATVLTAVNRPNQQQEAKMAQQYQGRNINACRDAREGDPGFQKGGDQVVITQEDGTEKTVKRSEVTGQAQPR